MSTMMMMVGISGSGKSYAAGASLGLNEEVMVHSSDAIREELYGDASVQRDHEKVFDLLHSRIYRDLKDGKNVVYDATNLSKKRRVAFLKTLALDTNKVCIVTVAPISVCIERDAARDRTVGSDVILRQAAQFQPPYYDEGWNSIVLINNCDEQRANQELHEIFWQLSATPHDNPYHLGTIGDHINRVQHLMPTHQSLAALHDIGKFYTKTFDDDGVAHYYGHEYVSALMSLTSHTGEDMNPLLRAYVISLHMRHYGMDRNSYAKFLADLPTEVSNLLIELGEADEMGA